MRNQGRILATLATVSVIGAVTAGLTVMDGPSQERARRIDDRRVDGLQTIQRAVDCQWTLTATIPKDLSNVIERCAISAVDPETGKPYVYKPVSETGYELCAAFTEASEPNKSTMPRAGDHWRHGKGEHCFTLTATKVNGLF